MALFDVKAHVSVEFVYPGKEVRHFPQIAEVVTKRPGEEIQYLILWEIWRGIVSECYSGVGWLPLDVAECACIFKQMKLQELNGDSQNEFWTIAPDVSRIYLRSPRKVAQNFGCREPGGWEEVTVEELLSKCNVFLKRNNGN